jgi:hypothetical protein
VLGDSRTLFILNLVPWIVAFTCVGASSHSRKADLAKLKSLSAAMHREELTDAARRTYCYRSEVTAKTNPTFAACVSVMPCYVTIPAIVRKI